MADIAWDVFKKRCGDSPLAPPCLGFALPLVLRISPQRSSNTFHWTFNKPRSKQRMIYFSFPSICRDCREEVFSFQSDGYVLPQLQKLEILAKAHVHWNIKSKRNEMKTSHLWPGSRLSVSIGAMNPTHGMIFLPPPSNSSPKCHQNFLRDTLYSKNSIGRHFGLPQRSQAGT